MSKFFNPDGPLMRFMTKLADLMILNILFLVTSLPVVTVGAAWTALSYVTLKMVRDEEGAIARSYFRAFRQNFRQATVLWLGVLAIGAVLVLDFRVLSGAEAAWAGFLRLALGLLAAALVMILQYLFPVLARFDASLKDTLKNAALLALAHLPKTALMTAAAVGAAVISLWSSLTVSVAVLVWLMIGFAAMAFGNAGILAKIFEQHLPKQEPSEP